MDKWKDIIISLIVFVIGLLIINMFQKKWGKRPYMGNK